MGYKLVCVCMAVAFVSVLPLLLMITLRSTSILKIFFGVWLSYFRNSPLLFILKCKTISKMLAANCCVIERYLHGCVFKLIMLPLLFICIVPRFHSNHSAPEWQNNDSRDPCTCYTINTDHSPKIMQKGLKTDNNHRQSRIINFATKNYQEL